MNIPRRRVRLPRRLHAGAWWLWAIGLGGAAASTTNPLVLALIVSVAALVVTARRSDASWARGFRAYLFLGLFVVALRVAFRVLLGAGTGDDVLFSLPRAPLPEWAAGIEVGGPVTAGAVAAGLYDGMRLAAMIVCVGAANSLADPRRLLPSLPRALHDVGTSVAVAVSLAPQLIESVGRVRRARRLRGSEGAGLRSLLVPVLEDAIDRSIRLAGSMGSRGFGRVAPGDPHRRRRSGLLLVGALGAVCIGMFGLLAGTWPAWSSVAALGTGVLAALAGVVHGGRLVPRTRYRRDPWGASEWLVAGSGLACAAGVVGAAMLQPATLLPSVQPLVWPQLSVLATLAVLVAATPALSAPPVSFPTAAPRRERAAT